MTEVLSEGAELNPNWQELIRSTADYALKVLNQSGDLCVLLSTGERIRELNRDFRNIDRVTDVLTFPAWEGESLLAPPDGYLGDIMICVERAIEQAAEYGHSIQRELCFLTVHGVLHLLGYDHIQPEDELIMREKQTEILKGMGQER